MTRPDGPEGAHPERQPRSDDSTPGDQIVEQPTAEQPTVEQPTAAQAGAGAASGAPPLGSPGYRGTAVPPGYPPPGYPPPGYPPPGYPPGYPPPMPFAAVSKQPWINPRQRRRVGLLGAVAALVLLGTGIAIGAAAASGGHEHHATRSGDRFDTRYGPMGGERGYPRAGQVLPGGYPPRRLPGPGGNGSTAPSTAAPSPSPSSSHS